MKEKLDILAYIKMKHVCISNQVRSHRLRGVSHISYNHQKLISRISRELQLNNKKPSNSTEKGTKDLNRQFTEEETWMANKYIKRSSTSLAIREIKLKPQDSISLPSACRDKKI